jgi:hypothetical protein
MALCGSRRTARPIPVPRLSPLRTKLLLAAGSNTGIGVYQQDSSSKPPPAPPLPLQIVIVLDITSVPGIDAHRQCQLLNVHIGIALTIAQSYQRQS